MAERRALFLDRDGTVNIDRHYVHRIEDFEPVPGIFELCAAAAAKGYALVVVTNQSGIERGYFTMEQYEAFTDHMRSLFAQRGAPLLDVLCCPFLNHPDRKPNPGMFLKAAEKWGIDLAASVSLGDKPRDVAAADVEHRPGFQDEVAERAVLDDEYFLHGQGRSGMSCAGVATMPAAPGQEVASASSR